MAKRIIITVVDGLHFRYIVDAGVLRRIADRGFEVLILTIPALCKRMEDQTSQFRQNIQTRLLEDVPLTRMRRIYMSLVSAANQRLSETLNYKNELFRKNEPFKYLLLRVLRNLAGTPPYRWIKNWTAASFSSGYYRRMISEFRPSLIVFSTPGQKLHDLPLLYECLRAGIATISPVYSWDNLTAKGPFIFRVDKLIVWNEIMRDEAIRYHGFTSNDVEISGVPVFDPYLDVIKEGDQSADFRLSLGLNPDKPLITITTIPQIFFGGCHFTLVKRILSFMEKGSIRQCAILLRPHPKDMTDYAELEGEQNVVVDTYGSAPDDSLMNWVPRNDNITHLGRTMKYSDVVINIASTITIDAACFDTPIINVAYDMKINDDEYLGTVKRFYSYSHYQHVVESGAADIVGNDDELIEAINNALNSPKSRSAQRAALVRQQTGSLDGRAHERVADSIVSIITPV